MYVSMYLKEAENKISIRNTTVHIDHMYVSLVNKVRKRLYYYNCNWIVFFFFFLTSNKKFIKKRLKCVYSGKHSITKEIQQKSANPKRENEIWKRICNWIVKMNYLQSTTNNLTNWLNNINQSLLIIYLKIVAFKKKKKKT